MPGGGLIALTKYGTENQYLNGNPELSYFSKVFRRHTAFSLESTTFAFDGPDELFYDRPIQIRCKIKRIADLVTDAYFMFDLPEIYCKYIDLVAANRSYQYNFAWVNYIGASIIDRVSFSVAGQRIQEFDGAYIVAKAHADMSPQQLEKWKRLVGEVPELVNPGLGMYGGGSETVGYPIVYSDGTTEGAQNNRPSTPRYTVRVPLPFWFSEDPSLAFPLVSLQYVEAEVNIQLRSIQDLYTVLDPSGVRVRPGFRLSTETVPNNPEFTTDNSVPDFRTFLVDIGITAPPLNMLAIRPRLEVTYVYLTRMEQQQFATQPLSYLVSQVTRFNHTGIFNRQQLDLECHNLGRRIMILPRRTDSIQARNAWYNFTNWATYPYPPYSPTPGVNSITSLMYSSGRAIPQGQYDIVRGMRFLVDGNELQEEKDTRFYSDIIPYKYIAGEGMPGILYMNFGLTSTPIQPAGSINFSLIRKFQAEVDVWPLPALTNYLYDFTFYVETYNHFVVVGGIGEMKYAL